jgi:hypothetical protein
MSEKKQEGGKRQGVSNLKLALGAASLFLFIVGVKRTFKLDEVQSESTESESKRK